MSHKQIQGKFKCLLLSKLKNVEDYNYVNNLSTMVEKTKSEEHYMRFLVIVVVEIKKNIEDI